MMRSVFLSLGKNKTVVGLARKYGLKLGATKFVAGVEIEEAIKAIELLNGQGKLATLDHLGEYAGSKKEAEEAAAMCLRTLEAIAASGASCNLSLKLTSLGLDADPEACERYMRQILRKAGDLGNFVRIDMEDYGHCQPALDLYRKLKADFPNVGIVIQAYLRRSARDVAELGAAGANLRLVKGAYKEPESVAYPDKSDVDRSFMELIRKHSANGYTAIATHDRGIVEETIAWMSEQGIARDRFEFQMLYGISEELQKELVAEGYAVRIYVPFGKDWFGYFMRRLAERPANVWFVLKHMFN
jgi:proline dehydrogenase